MRIIKKQNKYLRIFISSNRYSFRFRDVLGKYEISASHIQIRSQFLDTYYTHKAGFYIKTLL